VGGDVIVTHGSETDCKMDDALMRKVGLGTSLMVHMGRVGEHRVQLDILKTVKGDPPS